MRDRRKPHLLQEQTFELCFAVFQALTICGINDPDERVCLLEVILPVCAKGFLATHVPCALSVKFWHAEGQAGRTNVQLVSSPQKSVMCGTCVLKQ